MMKYYELTYLITPILSEEDARAFQEKVVSLINEEGGNISAQASPQRRKLAYPIKKQGQAYLAVLVFQLNPEKLADLEKKLKAEGQILRYLLLVKTQPKEIKTVPRRFAPKKIPPRPREKREKVELKEIEKKLEEILDEG